MLRIVTLLCMCMMHVAEDVYVDVNLSQETITKVRGLRQWLTNEFKHSGIRDDGTRIFDRLLNIVRDQILLD